MVDFTTQNEKRIDKGTKKRSIEISKFSKVKVKVKLSFFTQC